MDAIVEASAERAQFLAVREIENLFLDARVLADVLEKRCGNIGLVAPAPGAVAAKLAATLTRTNDPFIFPGGPPASESPADVAKGSNVLHELFWDFTNTPYDKVADGRVLASAALRHDPMLLDPVRNVVARLRP